MQVQGIILQKIPYQDRNAIVKLLLRNGQKGSAIFYGAHGLGRQKKSSQVELGTMLNVVLRIQSRSGTSELAIAKEWTPAWSHQHIRYHYPAYSSMCLFLELAERVAQEAHWPEVNLQDSASQGPFRALSNALFHLESHLKDRGQDSFSYSQHVLIFLGKLLAELGLYPQVQDCVLCGHIFAPQEPALPLPDKGGLACLSCLNTSSERSRAQALASLIPFLKSLWTTKYTDLFPLLETSLTPPVLKASCHSLMNYLQYQCQWGPHTLRSWDAQLQ